MVHCERSLKMRSLRRALEARKAAVWSPEGPGNKSRGLGHRFHGAGCVATFAPRGPIIVGVARSSHTLADTSIPADAKPAGVFGERNKVLQMCPKHSQRFSESVDKLLFFLVFVLFCFISYGFCKVLKTVKKEKLSYFSFLYFEVFIHTLN